MKKTFLFLIPVILFMTSCDEMKSKFCNCQQTVVTDTVIVHDTIIVAPGSGTVSLPANVFDDVTTAPINAATVIAKDPTNKTAATVLTDADGNYNCTTLTVGKTYTFQAKKTGYVNQTKTAVYNGTNSLPWFGLVH